MLSRLSRLWNYMYGSRGIAPAAAADEKKPQTEITSKSADLLGAFQSQLKNKEAEFFRELETWKKHREFEFSTASFALQHLEQQDPVLHEKVKGIFSRISSAIKKALEPANRELDDLMNDVDPHLTKLKDHLNTLCRSLKEKSGGSMTDEIKKIRIDICDTSIIMLNDLIVLTNDIAREIEYCLKSVATAKIVSDELFDTIIRLILGIPVPAFNIDLNNPYRHFLYDEIREEKERFELDETELEGDLQKAERLLEQLPAFAANPATLFKPADAKNEVIIDVENKIQAII